MSTHALNLRPALPLCWNIYTGFQFLPLCWNISTGFQFLLAFTSKLPYLLSSHSTPLHHLICHPSFIPMFLRQPSALPVLIDFAYHTSAVFGWRGFRSTDPAIWNNSLPLSVISWSTIHTSRNSSRLICSLQPSPLVEFVLDAPLIWNFSTYLFIWLSLILCVPKCMLLLLLFWTQTLNFEWWSRMLSATFFLFSKGDVFEICREHVYDRFLSLSFAKGRHSQMLRGTFWMLKAVFSNDKGDFFVS